MEASSNAFLYAYTSELGYRAVAAHLRKIERVFVQRLRRKPRYALEIRRRTAENLLKEAIRLGCSFKVCRERMRELKTLGFSDIQTKSTHLFIYAKAAMRRGHRQIALRITNEMTREWETLLRRRNNLVGKRDLQLFKALSAELE